MLEKVNLFAWELSNSYIHSCLARIMDFYASINLNDLDFTLFLNLFSLACKFAKESRYRLCYFKRLGEDNLNLHIQRVESL